MDQTAADSPPGPDEIKPETAIRGLLGIAQDGAHPASARVSAWTAIIRHLGAAHSGRSAPPPLSDAERAARISALLALAQDRRDKGAQSREEGKDGDD